jgi:hypothetical protein
VLKRFALTAFILAFMLIYSLPLGPALADVNQMAEHYIVYPFMAIGMDVKTLEASQGKGEYQYSKSAEEKSLSGIVYELDWSELLGVKGQLDTEYAVSKVEGENIINQITIRFPDKADREQLIGNISAVLGTPADEGKVEKAPYVYCAKWYREGILYELQDYGTYIKMHINHAKFTDGKKYNLPEDMFVLAKQKADINGDGKKEFVSIIGKRRYEDSIYMENINILVEPLNGEKGYAISLGEYDGGYLPGMELWDFTGDEIPEVMVSIPTGGSGGIIDYYIYSLKDKPELIFDPEKVSVEIEGEFVENYKGKIHARDPKGALDIIATIDLKDRKDVYDELEIYKDGKLVKDMYHELMPYQLYGLIKAVDVDNDGVMELEAYQSVRGCCNADFVANIITIWKWENDGWNLHRIAVEN